MYIGNLLYISIIPMEGSRGKVRADEMLIETGKPLYKDRKFRTTTWSGTGRTIWADSMT